ncbi:MAG TPA: thiosulfate oxidation carrier protein SoxY [Burkholderiales bacterium]|nr:thiosulfate oxidation carrier protein SoxY [Burkholderiales bacterium]
MNRRVFISIVPLVFCTRALGQRNAHVSTIDPLVRSFTNGADVLPGKVKLVLPKIADNGHSVPVTVKVDSPMTPESYVKSIHLISEKNPVREMATFYFGPHSGRAEVGSRIRLNGTQRMTAIAELSDGSFWSDQVAIEVREAACTDGG